MIAASLFSGIGAPETAMPYWHWAWCAEIEPFPSAVLASRHPASMNLGDVTTDDFADRAGAISRPDVLVFGSPCQSFSVAGRRLGLDDPRGNLALVALRIVARLAPRWFCFENVPGLLSSSEGRDFGLFLRAVDELGYSLSWAMLDAQHFGLAQRRVRLFAVGHLGDWRGPAAVLLEPESLCGNTAPRRDSGKGLAPTIASRSKGGGGLGTDFDCDGGLIAGSLNTSVARGTGQGNETDFLISSHNVAQPLLAKSNSSHRADAESYIAHSLRADGFDASEDGTGRGTPIVPIQNALRGQDQNGVGIGGDVMFTLDQASQHAIAQTLTADWERSKGASAGNNPGLVNPIVNPNGVRRLTPRECERLQGYPDDFTLITYRGKLAADGPRYRALGNSMAVPVIRWILSRIEQVDARQEGA